MNTFMMAALFTASNLTTPPVRPVDAKLTNVTVYTKGAEMTHKFSIKTVPGNSEWVLEGVSNNIDIPSIQVKTNNHVVITSVQFARNYLDKNSSSPAWIRLADSAKHMGTVIASIENEITTIDDTHSILKKNQDIKGSGSGLNIDDLVKLMDYYKAKSNELHKEKQRLQQKLLEQREVLQRVQQQMQEITDINNLSEGNIILQVHSAVAGTYPVEITYYTPLAGWKPGYDIKSTKNNQIELFYKASITQSTGIKWKQVKLTLSTSSPAAYGNAPVIQPWFLSYPSNTGMVNMLRGAASGVAVDSALEEMVIVGYGTQTQQKMETPARASEPLYVLNGAIISYSDYKKINPHAIKSVEKLNASNATAIYGSRASGGAVVVMLKEGLPDYISVTDNALDVTFNVSLLYDVETNLKEQTVILQQHQIASDFQYFTVPRYEKTAFLRASIPDWRKYHLLPGQANIMLDGAFVGKTFLDPAQVKDSMLLTMGREKRVTVRRDKKEDFSSTRTLGSNTVQKLTYEIVVKNNKNDALDVLVQDQIPVSTLKEIEVELIDGAKANVEKETGILTWNIALKPGQAETIRYTYQVKYPKSKTIIL